MTRLVDRAWSEELEAGLRADATELRLVCPFLKLAVVRRILAARPRAIRVVTRFNLDDCARGVSDLSALKALHDAGARVRGVRKLHAKVYVFGGTRAIVTSANLTTSGLSGNHEFGLVSEESSVVAAAGDYVERLWAAAEPDLEAAALADWTAKVAARRASARPDLPSLGDFGADLGIRSSAEPVALPAAVDAPQGFVKFLGRSNDRVRKSFPTVDEIESAGCHWALTYPTNKRPRGVVDGALMFIGRLTYDPNDILVFGRAIGMAYVEGRDDASEVEIAARTWKADWQRYIRVHDAEFVAGPMSNGVSLNALMAALGTDAFAATQRNAAAGHGNINPRAAYSQQPAVELSREGIVWLTERLDQALARHGRVPADTLDRIGWPTPPMGPSPSPHRRRPS